MTTRRSFLKSTVVLATALTAMREESVAQGPHLTGETIGGRLLAVGFGAKRLSSVSDGSSSVITEVSLDAGIVRQMVVPLASAHSLLMAADGRALCLPLDGEQALWIETDLSSRERLQAPKGYLFSGHGVLSPVQGQAFVSLRQKDARSFTDTGRIAVIDLTRRQLLGMVDSGGVRPHDLALAGGKLLVSHYGDINYESAGKTATNRRQPRLVTIDPIGGRVLQVIDTPVEGSLTHIAASPDGQVVGVPLNYLGFDAQGRRDVETALGGRAFEVSVAEELEGRIAAPMPLYLFDTKAATMHRLAKDLAKQRRAQSVAYHSGSQRFFVTYSFSDTLAVIDRDEVQYLSGFDLGLSYVRGVCALGTSGLVAVTGEFRGITLIDAANLNVVKRIDVALYDTPHVQWAPSAGS